MAAGPQNHRQTSCHVSGSPGRQRARLWRSAAGHRSIGRGRCPGLGGRRIAAVHALRQRPPHRRLDLLQRRARHRRDHREPPPVPGALSARQGRRALPIAHAPCIGRGTRTPEACPVPCGLLGLHQPFHTWVSIEVAAPQLLTKRGCSPSAPRGMPGTGGAHLRSSSLSAYERRSIQGAHTQHGSSSQCSLQITSTCGPRSSSLRSTRSRRCQLKLPTAGQASHGVRTHRALACRPPPTVSDRAPLTPRKGSATLRGARPGRAGGNSVLATSACASTAIPANSAYALTGISGDAASAKSAAAVAAPAAIMACAPPPPSSQRYAVRRTLGPHAWTGGTRMCRHLADSTCGSLGLMLCSCSCRAVFLPGEAAGRARRRRALAHVGDAGGQRGRDQRLHQRLHVRVKVQEGILAADAQQQVESAQLQRAKVGHLRAPSRARPAGPPRAARVGRAACSQRSALLPLASGCGITALAASACGSRDTGPRMRARQVTGMGSGTQAGRLHLRPAAALAYNNTKARLRIEHLSVKSQHWSRRCMTRPCRAAPMRDQAGPLDPSGHTPVAACTLPGPCLEH